MSTLQSYTSGTRPAASANSGLCIFRSDTNSIEVSDGTDWLAYASDGTNFGDNSYVAELNGTNQYLTLGDVSGTLGGGGVSKCTISWWMKQPAITSPTYRRVWQMSHTYNDNLWAFWNTSNWIFGVGTGSNGYVSMRTSGTSTIDDNQWHLWTLVYDGTQSSNTTKVVLYKDNAAQTIANDSGGTIATSLPSGTGDEPHIGALYINNAVSQYSDASFDDFAIFNDALTSTQIANIYYSQIYPSSLQHLYRLENNVNDSVGSANGTQVNSPITNTPSSPQFPY